jgi:AraC-like DNA-binding protein
MTFIEYLTKYRLQKARMQLMATNSGILEIALNNGFSDDRRLILAFKEEYGTTPFQYRKMERNKEE